MEGGGGGRDWDGRQANVTSSCACASDIAREAKREGKGMRKRRTEGRRGEGEKGRDGPRQAS